MPNTGGSGTKATVEARRRRTRLVPTIAAAAAVALFVVAGNWQRDRMQVKQAMRAQLDAAARTAPIDVASLSAAAEWPALRFRAVTASGEFISARQILVDNKVHAGRAGYDVVAPLRLADGRIVLVARGWVAQGASRDALPDAPPPAGAVTLSGRLALPPEGYVELATETTPGTVWQNLDPRRFAAATGLAVLPVVIEQTAPAGDGLVRDWPDPDFGIEKHRIYMLQWYAFAALAAGLWLYFGLWRPARGARE